VIRWPTPQQQVDIARYIEDKCALPGVVGFVDGCHIRLSSALKGDPSMHLQIKNSDKMSFEAAVVDHEMRITHVYTGWPGCVHDARRQKLDNLSFMIIIFWRTVRIHARNWLKTPFKNFGNLTPQQTRFNRTLSSVRSTVERAFGHLNCRFRRLQNVPFHNSEDICKLIYAACILHNLCLLHEDDVEGYIQEDNDPNNLANVYANGHIGVVRRLRLVNLPN
ncbi:LOW QUALITY PROTEIN: HARB1-like protein, partial [Mya arenaria]